MWGPCSDKFEGPTAQDQNERPNDRVLFNFCHTISTSFFVYSSAYFPLVCSEMFSLFLLIGNFDLINFWHTCLEAPKV